MRTLPFITEIEADLLNPEEEKWDYKMALEKALHKREALLEKNPNLKKLQFEIEQNLDGVDGFEDRMKILGKMIDSNIKTLFTEWSKLQDLCNKTDILCDSDFIINSKQRLI